MSKGTLLLTKEQARSLVSDERVIEAVEYAYRGYCSGQVEQPDYIGFHLPDDRGEIDFKLGYFQSSELISVKTSSGGFKNNPETYGVPNGMGTVTLFDARSGALICIMDGSFLTGLRTGAAGAVSVKLLARKNSKKVTAIGTGNQARMQIRFISKVMAIEQIHAWDHHTESLEAYKSDIEAEFNIPVVIANSPEQAVEQADVLITTTRGKGAIIDAAWIKSGTHVVAIGTDQQGKQELDPEIFRNAKVVVDSISQCAQKGEIQHPLQRGIIAIDDIHGEIGELLLGNKAGRESNDEITIFDSTGMAIQDNTTAGEIYKSAICAGTGTTFNFLAPQPQAPDTY